MLCEECKKEQAIIHILKYENGQTSERHLCEACARKEGLSAEGMSFGGEDFEAFGNFTVNSLLSSLLDMDFSVDSASVTPRERPTTRCPQCGQSFRDFHRTGRLGCANCYSVFGTRLKPLLRRVQGATEHRGKIPLQSGRSLQLRYRIEELKQKLQRAVAAERFEDAAVLRDEIYGLEHEMEVSSDESSRA